MNKDLILLQKNCPATAVIVLDEQCGQLKKSVVMKATVSDNFLFAKPFGLPPFAEKIEKNIREDVSYFVIKNIDHANGSQQQRFVGLVKDREFFGYTLPKNCIVVFTVDSAEGVKKILPQLYHFCVAAF